MKNMSKILSDLATFIFGLVEILLLFRFVLKLFAANPAAPFVAWIYENTQPLLQPFLFAFPTPSVQGGYTIEFTTLFALFVYAFASYLIQEFLFILNKQAKNRRK